MIRRRWAALRRHLSRLFPAREPATPPAPPLPPVPASRLEPESARVRADIAILRAELRLQLPRDAPRPSPSRTEPSRTQREDRAR